MIRRGSNLLHAAANTRLPEVVGLRTRRDDAGPLRCRHAGRKSKIPQLPHNEFHTAVKFQEHPCYSTVASEI
eukprot:1743174-Pleurochrysis_carterae.AAC.1